MSNWEVRQNVCGLCILVKGFIKETHTDNIMNVFPESVRSAPVIRSINSEQPEKEWIVQFRGIDETKKYIGKKIDCQLGYLEVNACELPCDIPEEWLQPLLYPTLQHQSANNETESTEQSSTGYSSSYQHQTDLWVPPTQQSDEDPRLCHKNDDYSTYRPTGDPRYPYTQNDGVPQQQYPVGERRFTDQQGRNDRAPFTIQPVIGPRFPLQQQLSFGTEIYQQPRFPLKQRQEIDSLPGAEGDPRFLYQQHINESGPLVQQPVRDPRFQNQQNTNDGDPQSQETAANPNLQNKKQEQPLADNGPPTQQTGYTNQPQTAMFPGQVPQHPNRQVHYPVPPYWGPQQQFSPFRQGFYMGMPQHGQYGMQQAGYGPYGGYYPSPQHGYPADRYQQQFPSASPLLEDGHEDEGTTSQGVRIKDHNQQGSNQTMEQTDVPMDDWEVIGNDSNTEEDKEYPDKIKMLKVSKIPKTSTEDTLVFFFENTRKFGGGDIESITYDKRSSTAIITFEEDDGVEKVLNKVPIIFGKTILEVEAYIPEKSLQNESTEEDCSSRESDFEAETVCTIEVSGMKKTTTEDTVMYYFESRKGANDDVKNIEFVEDKNMYLVTFENEEAVNTAMAKKHIIDGADLRVKKYVPPKRYPNKVLVSGLGENISADDLMIFLEAKTKIDVQTVEMGEKESGKAIVTFEKSIGIEEIQASVKNKSFKDNHIKVHPVEMSNCIIVSGYSEETTYEAIENYFDNKRRSGVDGVTDCKMNEDENYCLIYFEDPKDAIVATQRKHVLSKCTLSVNIFYDCLGIPAHNEEGSKFKPLSPVTVHNIDKQKVKFMLHAISSEKEFQKQLQNIHAEVHWPSLDEDRLMTIHSTLTKDTKDWQKISKTWEEDVQKQVDVFLEKLLVEKLSTLQESWDQVMNKVRQIDIPNPDNVILSVEKPPICEIHIVGITSDVAAVSQKVKNIIDEITEDLNLKKQQVMEDVQLKHHQLLILDLTDFPSIAQNTVDNIEINIDIEALKIKFKGISSSVVTAKLKMYEVTGTISSASLGSRSPEFIQFLDNPKVTKSVLKRMKDQQCIGVWEVHNKKFITLYSTSDEEVSKAADVFKDSIIETKVDGNNLQKSLLHSKKWIQHLKAIEDECHRKLISVKIIADKQGEIILLCTSKAETAVIKEEIQNFFYSNTEIELKLELEKSKLKFLQEHMRDEVENLESQLKQQHIIVAVKSDNVLVKANQQGIQEAQKHLDALVKNIYKTEHSMDKPGLHKLMDTDKGKSKLKQIGKQAGVVISIEGGEGTCQGFKSSTDSDGRVVYVAGGGQEVIVIKGDITGLSVDVIVNAANKDLVHSGGLAKVLINKGGNSIQQECDQYTKRHGQLSEGEVFCSGPGSLHCKHIVHAVGPIWQGGRNKEEGQLYDCVTTSLEETDKRNLSSIAIPALCTGIFGYPVSEATKVITESVRDYFKKTHSSSIKTVFLCDIVTSTVDMFIQAGNKFFNQPDGKYRSTPGRGCPANRFSDASHNKGSQNITTGNIKIKILKEELNKMKVDAIVNTTSRDLQLRKGVVSASLLKYGGSDLQKECSKKHPNGVKYGEVAVTSGGRLHCKIVCHGSLEQWKADGSSIKVFETFIMNCLHTADKKGFRSIAFPAMGTGNLNYPRDLVAKHMYKCVDDFSSKNPKSTITEVFFVLYHRDHLTVQAFENQEIIQQKSRVEHEKPTTFQGKGNKKQHEDDKVYSINLGKIVLKVYQGDITTVQVEVIVNSSNTNLDMSLGEVSKAILQKGGEKIKKQLLSQKTDMKNDGIAVTTSKGSGLLCDVVIHVDMQETTHKLKEKITHVLEKAEELGKISVAFPALGTSNANITVKDTAEDMYSAVNQFQSKSLKHVKEVHVVIFQNDQMKTFMEAIKLCVSTGNKKGWMDYVFDCAIDYLGYGSLSDNQTKILTEDRQRMSREKQSTAVTFVIYAKNKEEAKRAVTVLETELDQEYVSRKIVDRMVSELNPEQITALKFIGKSENVEILVDKGNKEIVLTGIIDNISSAMSAANKIIQTAQEQKQLNQKAKLVTDMVQWSFVEEKNGKKTFVEFPHDVNLLLEEAFKDNSSKVTFLASDGSKMIIDLTSYKMFPEDDPTDDNGVIRKTKLVSDSDFKPPDHWDDMADDEYIKIVPLIQSSKEYTDVLTDFNKTGGASYTVVKIDRIQNKVLNQQYIAKKKLMDATNPPGYQNERRPVWHGTNKQAIENIINTGFNRSYCSVTAYGKGVYFAVNVSYSAPGYSRVDPTDGLKRMLMCKVLAGEFTVGNNQMRTPPPKTQSAAGSHILYDSTTNHVSSPGMFVIYHDSQAVAEYLVTFKQ
ncbi:Protein mono-ADP-ribosyltransferase PARP15 [Mytilus coruscus]|uniref:Poly [ADP-ribose] polymerase n=1 Tax=Mytilus coruscus TaxID=42192 RepID=A0A6J8CBT9_MYTCO|nr:Protein mono-ADP-ribosyltransferase PARP15 [Mytilus coruscus]